MKRWKLTMARRTIDPSMLSGLVQGSMTQEVQKGNKRTSDPKFPVFSTPVNEDILVYIPRTNVISTENGEEMQVLPALIHDAKIGKAFTSLRCISGLVGGFYDQLGYDGACPACDGMAEVWDLYNAKMAAEAKRLNIDLQNDPNDAMKPTRENILREMDLKNPEEFVTFPICIIPTKARFTPTDDAEKNIKTVFVHWRRKRYEEKILGGLNSLMNNPGHPAGLFWFWKFSYNTEGKQATPMNSAKNATYTPISQGDSVAFQKFVSICEESAKEFTLLKAAEVVIANQFLFKDDIEADVNRVLAKTRQQLEAIKIGGADALAIVGGAQAPQLGAPENALANFGLAQQPVQSQSQAVNFGTEQVGQPVQPTQPSQPVVDLQIPQNPVSFQ